jgi:hypothetical protein
MTTQVLPSPYRKAGEGKKKRRSPAIILIHPY